MVRRRNIEDRFLEKAQLVESGCHEWQSTIHRDGYGKFWFDGKQIQAHRAQWLIFKGEIPEGLWVLHDCDNRKCVNPEHLYLGTPRQNVLDKAARCDWWGRMKVRGADIERAIIWCRNGGTQQSIADQLGVRQTTVSKWVRNPTRFLKRKY